MTIVDRPSSTVHRRSDLIATDDGWRSTVDGKLVALYVATESLDS